MSMTTTKNRAALCGLLFLALPVLGASGCTEVARVNAEAAKNRDQQETVYGVGNFHHVTVHGVDCIVFEFHGTGAGGISCDWANAEGVTP